MPGPGDLIWNAALDLTRQLTSDDACSAAAQQFVFDYASISNPSYFSRAKKINTPIKVAGFVSYLQNHPMFYDGTKSTLDFKVALCSQAVFRGDCGSYPGRTVGGDMNEGTITALTVTPSAPFMSFWQPKFTSPRPTELVGVGLDPNNNGVNIFNESNLFHEALHGITGLYDDDLLKTFEKPLPSENITIYIMKNILSKCPTFRPVAP
jgi:hypothetical protein